MLFSSSNISTNEALTIPVGTATTPIPIREMNVPNNLPPKVLGNISSKPTPVKDDTALLVLWRTSKIKYAFTSYWFRSELAYKVFVYDFVACFSTKVNKWPPNYELARVPIKDINARIFWRTKNVKFDFFFFRFTKRYIIAGIFAAMNAPIKTKKEK